MGKSTDHVSSFNKLKDDLLVNGGSHQISLAEMGMEEVQAVLHDAFRNGAVQEPIYGAGECLAYESLARPKDKSGREYSISKTSEAFYARGLHRQFDTLTCALGMKYGAQKKPLTLNVSVTSILTPEFYRDDIETRMGHYGFKPEELISEILEHDVHPDADVRHMQNLRERGFRFALDDFATDVTHSNRLHVFGGLVDFIKVKGEIVRAALGDPESRESPRKLGKVLDTIDRFYSKHKLPMPFLVAEHVKTQQETQTMFGMGFDGVQGRYLKPEFFPYTPEGQAALANQDHLCDHDSRPG